MSCCQKPDALAVLLQLGLCLRASTAPRVLQYAGAFPLKDRCRVCGGGIGLVSNSLEIPLDGPSQLAVTSPDLGRAKCLRTCVRSWKSACPVSAVPKA